MIGRIGRIGRIGNHCLEARLKERAFSDRIEPQRAQSSQREMHPFVIVETARTSDGVLQMGSLCVLGDLCGKTFLTRACPKR